MYTAVPVISYVLSPSAATVHDPKALTVLVHHFVDVMKRLRRHVEIVDSVMN